MQAIFWFSQRMDPRNIWEYVVFWFRFLKQMQVELQRRGTHWGTVSHSGTRGDLRSAGHAPFESKTGNAQEVR